jgi:hypothetical protein
MLGDFLAVREAVLDVQANSVLDVVESLFVGISLAVATLQRWTRNEIAVGVRFDNDRKCQVFHA